MSTDDLNISSGTLDLAVRPSVGGCLARFDWRSPTGAIYPLLRAAPPSSDTACGPLDMACFPLFPFSNRLANAQLHVDGRSYALPVNAPPEPHCLHGDAWQHPWSIADSSETSVTLAYQSNRLGEPFIYAAAQEFALQSDCLVATLTLTNTGSIAMPAGLGLHPYFERPPGTKLTARLPAVWLSDDSLIPTEKVAVPDRWNFKDGRVLDDVTVDANFTGWDGYSTITWPDRPVSLEVTASPELRNIVIYVPPGEDYFCFEPVSHENNAMNRASETWGETGVQTLEPGNTLTASITFRPVAL